MITDKSHDPNQDFRTSVEKVLFMEAVFLQRPNILCPLHMKSWARYMHLSPHRLQRGRKNGNSATPPTPPKEDKQIPKGLSPEHSGYLVKVQQQRGCQHQ